MRRAGLGRFTDARTGLFSGDTSKLTLLFLSNISEGRPFAASARLVCVACVVLALRESSLEYKKPTLETSGEFVYILRISQLNCSGEV